MGVRICQYLDMHAYAYMEAKYGGTVLIYVLITGPTCSIVLLLLLLLLLFFLCQSE